MAYDDNSKTDIILSNTKLTKNLTLFTTCKPFCGEAGGMQENAIQSWGRLGIPVIILGGEDGTSEIAEEIGAVHILTVSRSENGTPLLNSLFALAKQNSQTPYLAYINADIILSDSFVRCFEAFLKERHTITEANVLVTARRRNIPLSTSLFGNKQHWHNILLDTDHEYGSWDNSNANDLFLFNRELFNDIKPFSIGRMLWDNWLIWKAVNEKAAIVDCSFETAIYHPVHGYSQGWMEITQGGDAVKNRELSDGNFMDLQVATTHILKAGKIIKANSSQLEGLDVYCQRDPDKEFKASLKYLISTMQDREIAEKIDACRTLLWRYSMYFPTNDMEVILPELAQVAFCQAKDQMDAGQFLNSATIIQSLIMQHLVEKVRSEKVRGRDVVIWGSGEWGKKLQTCLAQHLIYVNAFIDSNKAMIGQKIENIPILHSTELMAYPKDKPYIIIASMYAGEIKKTLEDAGYMWGDDFWA